MQIIIKNNPMDYKVFDNRQAAADFANSNPSWEIIVCGTYGKCKNIKNKAEWIKRNGR